MDVKYPAITVELVGHDGNAYSIIGRVAKAIRAEAGPEAASEFMTEATAGDYDHLLATVMAWVDVT